MKKENSKNVVVVKKESELKEMKKEVLKNDVKKVKLFGDEIELRNNLDVDDVLKLIDKKFNSIDKYEVGKMCYYLLGLKKYNMIKWSNKFIGEVVRNLFISNGLECNTNESCVSWYNGKIKKGIVNIEEDFKKCGRVKVISNIDLSKYNFKRF